jgi:hypothetical protein
MISERDELLEKQGGGGNKSTVELSAKIRQETRNAKELAGKLQQIQKEQAAKAEKKVSQAN